MGKFKKIDGAGIFKNPLKVDHYTKNSQKICDFFLGFFGVIALFLLSCLIIYSTIPSIHIYLVYIVSTLIYFFLAMRFFKINRRFIAIGILSMLILGLFIFISFLIYLDMYYPMRQYLD